MKTLAILLATTLSFVAQAKGSDPHALIKKSEERIKMLQEAELVQFLPSPGTEVQQGDPLSLFIRSKALYSGANVILDATIDGSVAALSKPTADMWFLDAGVFHEIGAHEVRVLVSIEDKDLAAQYRTSLTQIDRDIATLERQISLETDPVRLADLIAQRNAKLSLRADLINSLSALKTPVGEETFRFQVIQSQANPNYPRVTNVYPNFVHQGGTLTMEVIGENFTASPEVRVAGHTISGTLVSPTRIEFEKPVFAAEGTFDVELRFPQAGGGVKNTILKNGLFIGSNVTYPVQNVPPVAVAFGGPTNFGQPITLNGTFSYDLNQDELSYSWKIISKPYASALPLNTEIATGAQPSFTGDVPGMFVLALTVTETNTAAHLQSAESLAAVEVIEPGNTPPALALSPSSLNLTTGQTAVVTAAITDPDFWQNHTLQIAQHPSRGTIQVLGGNQFQYTAGSVGGTDMVVFAVGDSANNPAMGFATLNITLTAPPNTPPTISGLFAFQLSEGFPLSIRWNATATDSNGINQYRWLYGDGFRGFGSTAANQSGSAFHDYVAAGPFSVQVFVRDTLGAESSATSSLDLTSRATNKRPVSRVTASTISGAAPLAVTFNGTASYDTDGTINVVRWNFGDGSAELQGGPELLTTTKTFSTSGTYNVRFRLRDNLNAETDHFIAIYVGTTPPAGGTAPTADYVPTPRQVTLGNAIAFDATRSNDPNPGAGPIANYAWSVQDGVTCVGQPSNTCSYSGLTTSHTYGAVGNYFPSLAVTGSGGTTSSPRIVEVHVVNQGQAPRAYFTASQTSGAVPLTVNFDSSNGLSGDYDGTIQSHLWDFGTGTSTQESPSFQFTVPGVYFVNHTVTDNDGNKHTATQMITANASLRAKSAANDDEERANQRALLTNACGQGQGEACYWLGKMHEEDGESSIAQKLFERACQLGHTAACSIAPWLKW